MVNSIATFNAAQISAVYGDAIIWQNGSYSNVSIAIYKNGLTLKAETAGGVVFNGTSTCTINGNNNIFSGFQYIAGDIGGNIVLEVNGSHNSITQINFMRISAHKYISITGGSQYNEVSYCNIENKPASAVIGCTIQISTSPTVPGYHKIRYCSFKNFPGNGGDFGNEPIRIGLGTEKDNISRTIVEYCYFENVGPGDSESISIKSSENVCRYNTFNKNPDGKLVFRQGYRNAAYGNFFINNSGGIRLKAGATDFVYNNYFQTGLAEPIILDYEAEFPLDKVYILHNTFIECAPLELTISGPKNILFMNNIFQKKSGSIVNGSTNSITFTGNIIYGSFGITVPAGNRVNDPQLFINTDGYFGISLTSPAINSANPNYNSLFDIPGVDDDPFLMLDVSGQVRPAENSLKDVGCDEFTTGIASNRPLKLSDVGPSYLNTTLIGKEEKIPGDFQLLQNYPNPFNPETTIEYFLQAEGHATLKVFDILGRVVVTLVDEFKLPGSYSVKFSTLSLSVTSGIYLCTLALGENISARKIILQK